MLSWGSKKTTLCEELHTASISTAENRQKAVDSQYNNIRDAVIAELREYAKTNKAKKTSVKFDTLFTETHLSGVRRSFARAVGTINPPQPTEQEFEAYGQKIAEELTEEGLVAEYGRTCDGYRAIIVNWEVVPEPPKEEIKEEDQKEVKE